MILELYYWENMTAKDIGDVLEIPEGTARTRIRRAKQLLEAQLADARDLARRSAAEHRVRPRELGAAPAGRAQAAQIGRR
jgi:DNA-directed RNA polymerase specialized sigma24 family protein